VHGGRSTYWCPRCQRRWSADNPQITQITRI